MQGNRPASQPISVAADEISILFLRRLRRRATPHIWVHCKNLVRPRGSPAPRCPSTHGTGKGWVKQVKGHYHNALYVKKSRVVVWLLETTGGICPHACAHGRRLAERARTRCVWGPSISVCSPGGQPANFYQEHGYSRNSSALISKRWFLRQHYALYRSTAVVT